MLRLAATFNESQSYPAATATAAGADPGTAVSWGPLIATVVVFFAILLIAVYIIRRLNRREIRGMSAPWARVLDRQPIGNRQVLYLVEIAGKLQVLGVTDQQMIKIAEINDPEVAAEILAEIAGRPQEKISGWVSTVGDKLFTRKKKKQDFSQELEHLLEEADKR